MHAAIALILDFLGVQDFLGSFAGVCSTSWVSVLFATSTSLCEGKMRNANSDIDAYATNVPIKAMLDDFHSICSIGVGKLKFQAQKKIYKYTAVMAKNIQFAHPSTGRATVFSNRSTGLRGGSKLMPMLRNMFIQLDQ